MSWTPSSTLRLSLFLAAFLWSASSTWGRQAPEGYGTVSGKAQAVFLIAAKDAPAPPACSVDGFRQGVEPVAGGWRVTVSVDASALKVRTPFRAGRLPSSLGMPPSFAADLASALAPCQRADEAVEAVLLTVKRRIAYDGTPGFNETESEVLARGKASCVGLTRLVRAILRALAIPCREVVGFKLPVQSSPIRLQGGVLHAWLEIGYPGGPTVFCDPLRSSGWVPETYVVLRIGGGLQPGELAAYAGGEARCETHQDRLFCESAPQTACVLWRRAFSPTFTGTVLAGKVLGALDAPLAGRVELAGPADTASMDLWEGNFFFRDLEPGVYSLLVHPAGQEPQRATVRLGPMDKRFLVLYSRVGAVGAPPGATP